VIWISICSVYRIGLEDFLPFLDRANSAQILFGYWMNTVKKMALPWWSLAFSEFSLNIKKLNVVYSFLYETRLTAAEHHLPRGIAQCYLPPNTGERSPSFVPSWMTVWRITGKIIRTAIIDIYMHSYNRQVLQF